MDREDHILYLICTFYQTLLNGLFKGYIKPTRGIRQGNPISSYLFILCTKVLVAQLHEAEWNVMIQRIQISMASYPLHIFYLQTTFFSY